MQYSSVHACDTDDMSFFPRTSTPLANPFNDSHTSFGSPYPATPAMSASTPPTSSTTPYPHASPFIPSEEPTGPPITRSRTLYYLSVRDSSTTRARSRRYRSAGTGGYGDSEGGLLGSGTGQYEERAGLMGDQGGRDGQLMIDVSGNGLPPKWSVFPKSVLR